MRRLFFAAIAAVGLSACAGYSGYGLLAGVADAAAVRAAMGEPALTWQLDGGQTQLAYPRGPAGFHTYMVYLDAEGRLQRIENALTEANFARITPPMREEEVIQLLGPPQPQWTAYFAARQELVLEWRYCNSFSEGARFNVILDATTRRVRSTMKWSESQKRELPVGCGQ